MLGRIFYSIKKSALHRKDLGNVSLQLKIDSVTDLTPSSLQRDGIRVLVLDFDGVLAPHGYQKPGAMVRHWLEDLLSSGCLQTIYIYSNKPTEERRRYFEVHHPPVRFVRNARKKPYPDGLAKIIKEEGIEPEALLMVDDRLLTGILASIIVRCSSALVRRPLVDFSHATVAELFFAALRLCERLAISAAGKI